MGYCVNYHHPGRQILSQNLKPGYMIVGCRELLNSSLCTRCRMIAMETKIISLKLPVTVLLFLIICRWTESVVGDCGCARIEIIETTITLLLMQVW